MLQIRKKIKKRKTQFFRRYKKKTDSLESDAVNKGNPEIMQKTIRGQNSLTIATAMAKRRKKERI